MPATCVSVAGMSLLSVQCSLCWTIWSDNDRCARSAWQAAWHLANNLPPCHPPTPHSAERNSSRVSPELRKVRGSRVRGSWLGSDGKWLS